MNYLKQNHLSILIIVFLAVSSFLGGAQKFGALDRTTIGNPWTFNGAVIFGSTITSRGITTFDAGRLDSYTNSTSTSLTSETMVAADFSGYTTVVMTPNVGNLTLTFPASSTMTTFLPAVGDTQHTCFVNGTTTANIQLILAGGTGTNLQVASSSGTVLGSTKILPGKVGCIDFVRGAQTATTFDINAALTAFQ